MLLIDMAAYGARAVEVGFEREIEVQFEVVEGLEAGKYG